MYVLINGMNMPHGCANCDFVGSPVYDSKGRAIYSCNVPVENLRGKDVTDHVIAMYEGARMSFPKWCPLVDLGKHGKLIDADALEPDADYDDGEYWAYSVAQVCSAPTVIEAEDGT